MLFVFHISSQTFHSTKCLVTADKVLQDGIPLECEVALATRRVGLQNDTESTPGDSLR